MGIGVWGWKGNSYFCKGDGWVDDMLTSIKMDIRQSAEGVFLPPFALVKESVTFQLKEISTDGRRIHSVSPLPKQLVP